MKQMIHALLGRVLRDYRINWIYATRDPVAVCPLRPGDSVVPMDDALRDAIALSATQKVGNSLSFDRWGLTGLVLVREGVPLCVAHFAQGALYDRNGTWPLRADEVALMDIATEEAARGQGLAPAMIGAAQRHWLNGSAQRLIAFIWWSNTPSVRAFAKAGWRRIGLSVEWNAGGGWHSLRLPLP